MNYADPRNFGAHSLAPYEKRVIELIRNGKDKRARKLAKKRVHIPSPLISSNSASNTLPPARHFRPRKEKSRRPPARHHRGQEGSWTLNHQPLFFLSSSPSSCIFFVRDNFTTIHPHTQCADRRLFPPPPRRRTPNALYQNPGASFHFFCGSIYIILGCFSGFFFVSSDLCLGSFLAMGLGWVLWGQLK